MLLPVKRPELAKTRLAPLGDDVRRELAVAFALDTLEAVNATTGVDEVVVVTDDPRVSGHARAADCRVAPDVGELNAALRRAATSEATGSLVVALCADLPALDPRDLVAALAQLDRAPAFVADRAGTGTTMYAAAREEFAPSFGIASAGRHRTMAVEVVGELATLRVDVDDLDSLRDAEDLGVGRHTRRVLDTLVR